MPNYEFAHEIHFTVGGAAISRYRYFDNAVSGSPAITSVPITVTEWQANMARLVRWYNDITSGRVLQGNSPSMDAVSDFTDAVRQESAPPSPVVFWDFSVGDLSVALEYNISASNLYRLTRSEFDISWPDFALYLRRLKDFTALYVDHLV